VRTKSLLMFALEQLCAHLLWQSHAVRLVVNLLLYTVRARRW
jgi:hypothetical protein